MSHALFYIEDTDMIFGIAGKLESGKDTVADYLVKGYGYTKMAFADNLKQLCISVFGITTDQCYTTEGKFKEFEKPIRLSPKHCTDIAVWLRRINNWPVKSENLFALDKILNQNIDFVSPRHLLQFVGTEIMRDCFDPDIHTKIIFERIKREDLTDVVISDARFENERKITREYGGHLILVDCVQTREQESTHRSETGLGDYSDYDCVVVNDKSKGFDYLYGSVNEIMECY